MGHFISSELLFYGGLALMAGASILAVFCTVIFSLGGKKLKKTLEKEYGRLKKQGLK